MVCETDEAGLAAEIARIEPSEIVAPDSFDESKNLRRLLDDSRAPFTVAARAGSDVTSERRLMDYYGVRTLDGFGALTRPEIAAAAAGVSILGTKVAAFTLAGAYGGASGALYAHYAAYISPSDFALVRSIEFLAMAVVGGEASILGAVVGALFFTYLPEWLRVFGKETYPTFFGLITLAALILLPTGLVGLLKRLKSS
jgi:hypothetical protein